MAQPSQAQPVPALLRRPQQLQTQRREGRQLGLVHSAIKRREKERKKERKRREERERRRKRLSVAGTFDPAGKEEEFWAEEG